MPPATPTSRGCDEAHERQVEEAMDTLDEGPEGFYGKAPKPPRGREGKVG